MVDQDKFAANLNTLKQGNAIPDVDSDHISEHVKEAISNLKDHEIDTLVELCKKTKSHLFLKDHATGMIVQGL